MVRVIKDEVSAREQVWGLRGGLLPLAIALPLLAPGEVRAQAVASGGLDLGVSIADDPRFELSVPSFIQLALELAGARAPESLIRRALSCAVEERDVRALL